VGVSTLAVNLALGLVQAWELPTTLVDMSFTCGQDALMLNLPLHNTWVDLTDIPLEELDRKMVMQVLLSYSTDLSILAAPSTPEQGDAIESGLVAATLQLLMDCNHYLILDLPHDFHERTLLGLDVAHRIVTVMSPEIASVYAMKRALEVFDNLGYDRNNIHLVLNQMFERHGIPREAIEDALGRSVDFVIPSASKQLVDAINRGIPLIEKAPDSRLGAALKDMAFDLSKEEHRSRQPVESATAWEHITRQLQQQQPE
jgi:pilus assembly protein CpaE